ncbi:MAG: deoxyribodipyrimidine photo-lyase [Acidimicrobiia bacterium]|nr:deoxyribodipyrimidine photo-lyase [Acidimicrobiia bacterium]
MTTTIIWFRRDLRLVDHPALTEAVQAAGPGGEVVALFCMDDRLWGPAGANRRAFLVGCLRALDESIGGRLVVRWGDPAAVVAAVAAEVDAREVFVTGDFAPYGALRDERVAAVLREADRTLVRVGSPYAVAPGSVLNGSGLPYKVFTPFFKAWMIHGWAGALPAPGALQWAALSSEQWPAAAASAGHLPEPGEVAAWARANRFYGEHLAAYDEQRNDPGAAATSGLAPYLKWGCLHPRQLLAELGSSRAEAVFRSELGWREFYADVLHHRPDTVRSAFNPAMAGMEVDVADTDGLFQAWCEGRTGFPIVDAGMRQLVAEGFMHNRVRMLVASFLVKDLHLDWTRGARFFMEHLADGDVASNQHGWQWVAGTGTDASPYFRIFNPVTQGERFDPRGVYVRRWVPELAAVGDRYVHHPWDDPAGAPPGYPAPMVDHAEERVEALRRYAVVRGR